jgi:hypothetical protein
MKKGRTTNDTHCTNENRTEGHGLKVHATTNRGSGLRHEAHVFFKHVPEVHATTISSQVSTARAIRGMDFPVHVESAWSISVDQAARKFPFVPLRGEKTKPRIARMKTG